MTGHGMSPVAHRGLKWFWAANLPPVIVVYLLVSDAQFARLMLLYLALVSIWANVASHAAGEDAAEARVAIEDEP